MKRYVYIFHKGIHIETKIVLYLHACIYVLDAFMIYTCLMSTCDVCVCPFAPKLGKFRFLRNSFHILQKYYVFCSTLMKSLSESLNKHVLT